MMVWYIGSCSDWYHNDSRGDGDDPSYTGTVKKVTPAMFSTTSDTRLMRRVASGSTLQVLWIVLIS